MRTKVTSILLLCTLYPSQNKALRHITEIGPTKFRPQFECFIENQSINQGNIFYRTTTHIQYTTELESIRNS